MTAPLQVRLEVLGVALGRLATEGGHEQAAWAQTRVGMVQMVGMVALPFRLLEVMAVFVAGAMVDFVSGAMVDFLFRLERGVFAQ